jgi:antitoxin PrlF
MGYLSLNIEKIISLLYTLNTKLSKEFIMQATLTSKGQITIPKLIRDALELHTGDTVDFIIEEKGKVVIMPKVRDITEIVGMVTPLKTVSVEEMNDAIAQRFNRKCKRDRD